MNNTLIFDMHGIIYSHDKNNSIKQSKTEFNTIINSQIPKNESEELTKEFESIQKALNHHKNQLNIFPMPNAIEKLIYHIKNNDKIIIISTSLIETQKLILKTFLKDEKLLNNINFYNSSQYGPKSDSETWYQILKNYENITELYEDTENYLDAAEYAVKQLGHKTCKFKSKIE